MQIVLVEDNQQSAKMLQAFFRQSGYEVHVAHDGETGLELICEICPQFAIIDLGLPKLSGHEVVKAVRARPENESIICIALTGDMEDDGRERALEAGFQEHFIKPVRPSTLIKCMANFQ